MHLKLQRNNKGEESSSDCDVQHFGVLLVLLYVQDSQRDVYILRAHARNKKRIKFHAKPTQNPRLFLAKSMLVPRYVHVHSSQEACDLREI